MHLTPFFQTLLPIFETEFRYKTLLNLAVLGSSEQKTQVVFKNTDRELIQELLKLSANYPAINIHSIGVEKQTKQQYHPYNLCSCKKFITRRFPCNHFIDKKHHMPSIQSRDWKNIHKSQND